MVAGNRAREGTRLRNRFRLGLEFLEPRELLSSAKNFPAKLPAKPSALEAAVATATTTAISAVPPRIMENLGRGVTVVRSSSTQAFISWRLLALDPSNIAFNVYRSANGAAPVRLNSSPLTAGTNFSDYSVNFAVANVYHVRPVLNGVEQPPSGSFTLKANIAIEPVIRVPLSDPPAAGYYTKFVWVGDLDGDGEYDFVIDRLAPFDPTNNDIGLGNQFLEAYKRDGTKLWSIDMGPTSTNTYNIEPGAATLSMGNWDGVTVADMNSDGKAEVLLKTANGVRFADGTVLVAPNNSLQYVSVINGMTGVERARLQFANDYLSDGAMGMMFGVGSVDGVHNALYVKGKNRVGSGGFNETVQTYAFDGVNLTRLWKWNRNSTNAPDGHQFRIIDVNGDGKDEYCEIGFCLNSNGTLRYSLNDTGGVVHGDRFHIGDFDPDRPGLEGYGIQQDNPSLLYDFYYDANTGQMLWQHFSSSLVDVGRGVAADIDPRYRGFETWAFNGTWNAPSNLQVATTTPYPQLSMQWDSDLLWETRNDGKIENWDYLTGTSGRLVTEWKFDSVESGSLPMFYGDIWGDWREEVVTLNSAENALTIFSTDIPTTHRIYTLAQDPAYRNCMTLKGYYQSNQLDYYLGDGMATPPTPNIIYAGTQPRTVDLVYQAELAARTSGVLVESNYSGFNGTGFVNYPATGGITWSNVDGGDGGLTTLRLRYALGNATARTGRITVNGVSQNVTFDTTGAWSAWAVLSLNAALTPGRTNTVLLESTGADLANIDDLQVAATVPAAPTLASVVVNDGTAQRSQVTSVTLIFNTVVNLAGNALTLTLRGAGGTTAPVAFTAANPSGDGRTYVLSFGGASLADGMYDLAVLAGGVTNIGGDPMTAGVIVTFHRLLADITGDAKVDAFDLNVLAGNWQKPTALGIAAGDLNLDGTVDAFDLNLLASRWQWSVG
jgi:hypothetical protein